MRSPAPIALGTHIQCLCGGRMHANPFSCATGIARMDWALENGVKVEKAKGWEIVTLNGEQELKPKKRRIFAKGQKCRTLYCFSLRSFNIKARAEGREVIKP